MPINIHVLENSAAASNFVAQTLADQVKHKKDSVLGLATGGTMPPVYQEFLAITRKQKISLSNISSFNLDEYVSLPAEHPQSYRHYMRQHLFDHIDADSKRLAVPYGDALDPYAEAKRYEDAIRRSGGIDLQLLGLGANGHIGFNEPGASFASRTHVEALTENTRIANARFFGDDETVPFRAITMGIATILEARAIILLATGNGKAQAVRDMLEEPVTTACPASALQQHDHVLVVLDTAAATCLSPTTDFRRHQGKPELELSKSL